MERVRDNLRYSIRVGGAYLRSRRSRRRSMRDSGDGRFFETVPPSRTGFADFRAPP